MNKSVRNAICMSFALSLNPNVIFATEPNSNESNILISGGTVQSVDNERPTPIMYESFVEYIIEESITYEIADIEELIEEIIETSNMSLANNIVDYAKQFIGTPYTYGGTSLGVGVDCSGFTSQVYAAMGIDINRTAAGQYWSSGTTVSKTNLQVGDLVFYGSNGNVSHVGMYIGDEKIIHASSSRGVVIDTMYLAGTPPIVGYKRIVA
ncbi:MAG: hypothetical protein ATN33_06265 [Epulopiscium sp. Nele67-Bin001]|nr:MAG: hypothetical protein BEN18_04825 [Epulopiscium sp. Nuni2H_MBin001]OON92981.1 MAG: hypothetical protein ATN33_06265 [Epulopiscium sp. Nele67-Bin001]